MGYEVERLNGYAKPYPELSTSPRKEDYETDEAYEEACKDYEQEVDDYVKECEEIRPEARQAKSPFTSASRARTSYYAM